MDLPERRNLCRVNGHVWDFEGEELGSLPDGGPQTFEVYVCSVCEKVNYEPVPD